MSRQQRAFVVLGFGSTHDALDAEALLEDLGMEVTPIPAPPAISANCGIALRLEPSDLPRAETYLQRAGIAIRSRTEIHDV
jgi:hypothetical protein